MRRPLKPFVTEYKGNNRRPKDGTGAFGMEAEPSLPDARRATTAPPKASQPKASQPKASDLRQAKQPVRRGDTSRETNWANDGARFGGAQGEDSYEAALRAADALFSSAPAPLTATRGVSPSVNDVFTKPEAESSSPAAGRILRAIDETPDPVLADIEAERAPKRRGRKPGSKNKPKIPAVLASASHAHDMAPETSDDDQDHPLGADTAPGASFSVSPRPSLLSSSPTIYPSIPSRGERRFAWIRTKLGPGEQWKRRLPKVIW